MTVFKSDAHLASWAGVSPGTTKAPSAIGATDIASGSLYLTTTLVEAAQAAIRKKKSHLRDKFMQLKAGRGYERALLASHARF